MGSAIECFKNAAAVVVPRSRFSPVKTCNDLFTLRSDAYELTADSCVVSKRSSPTVVKLDDKYYKLVDKMESFCSDKMPSLIDCDRLEVKGPVSFESDITFKGTCSITNEVGDRKALPAGIYNNQQVVL